MSMLVGSITAELTESNRLSRHPIDDAVAIECMR